MPAIIYTIKTGNLSLFEKKKRYWGGFNREWYSIMMTTIVFYL